MEYDAAGNQTAVIDQLGRTTTTEYNALHRPVRIVNPLGGETQLEYDDVGNVVSTTDELGNGSEISYDLLNRVVSVTDAAQGISSLEYDAVGNVIRSTDELGRVSTIEYDELNRPTTLVDPLGHTTTFGYDAIGNRTRVTDARNAETTFQYDVLNRITLEDGPEGQSQAYSYDAVGNLTSVTDGEGNTTIREYDLLDRIIRQTDPRGESRGYGYDGVGNLTTYTDPLGETTTFEFDDLDRMVRVVDPLANDTRHVYDAVGNRIQGTDRNGRIRTFTYDALDRLTAEEWLDNGAVTRSLNFSYDAVGNVITAQDQDSSYTYAYDDLYRPLSVDNTGTPNIPNLELTYQYDAVGNIAQVSDGSGTIQNSTYDLSNRLTNRSWDIPGTTSVSVDFTYDARNQMTLVERYSGNSQLVASTSYVYDDAGRTTGINHIDSSVNTIADYSYGYDLSSRLVSESHHGNSSEYTYDSAGQLLLADRDSQPDENFEYDENGNPVATGIVIGNDNRLLTDEGHSYEYDNEGNLVLRTETATGQYREFQYDYRNRLTAVTDFSAGGILLDETTYTYDVLDRRIATTINGATTSFVYNGDHVWADFDDSGQVGARYLFGDQTDQIIARAQAGQEVDWYLSDRQGTVRDIVDETGSVLTHLDYDSFGTIVLNTSPAESDRYTFTGREFDTSTGLYYYRARFYDSSTGRFISQDPMLFGAGDSNLYRYVFNSPGNYTDPSGNVAVTEYVFKLVDGPVGTIIASAQFNCYMASLTSWAAGQQLGGGSDGHVSLAIDVMACTMFPTQAAVQTGFVFVAELLALTTRASLGENVSAGQVALTVVQHTLQLKLSGGLSGFFTEAQGTFRPRIGVPGPPKPPIAGVLPSVPPPKPSNLPVTPGTTPPVYSGGPPSPHPIDFPGNPPKPPKPNGTPNSPTSTPLPPKPQQPPSPVGPAPAPPHGGPTGGGCFEAGTFVHTMKPAEIAATPLIVSHQTGARRDSDNQPWTLVAVVTGAFVAKTVSNRVGKKRRSKNRNGHSMVDRLFASGFTIDHPERPSS